MKPVGLRSMTRRNQTGKPKISPKYDQFIDLMRTLVSYHVLLGWYHWGATIHGLNGNFGTNFHIDQ